MEESVEQTEQEELVQSTEMEFYTVSQKKFLILFLGTFGIYSIYWFFKHWSQYKKSTNDDMWPIMRGVFSIFFTHSLFSLFEMKYQNKTGEAPQSINYLATVFVVISIIGNISDRLAGNGYGVPFTLYSSLIVLPIACWCLYQAQSLANFSSDDVSGSSNSKLTFLNYIWLVLGFIFWLLVLFGIYATSAGL
ncbi:MAG: hypothetical protein V5788_07170 [Shewanella sp.]